MRKEGKSAERNRKIDGKYGLHKENSLLEL
jgi:hypothetical protein